MNEWAKRERNPFDPALIDLAELTSDTCNTVACFAGWTDAVAGYRIRPIDSAAYKYDAHGAAHGGSVERVAQKLLGLSDDDAERLFYETDDDELDDAVPAIFGPDPRPQER
jgi:hypothetical protein